MKQKDKENLIKSIPAIVLIVTVGTITKYNLVYTIPAGIIGVLIGHLILKSIETKK